MTDDTSDRHLQAQARIAGAAYLVQNVLFFASLIIMSPMIVAGDFAATARHIAASESLYRVGLSIGVMAGASTTFLAWAFYVLLKRVDGRLAVFALIFRVSEAVFYGILFLLYFVAADICGGAASGLGAAGQQALWNVVSRGETAVGYISAVWFCFGASTFFYLLFKARFMPRLISLLGMLTAFLVLIVTFPGMIAPLLGAKLQAVVGAPLAATEILTGLWLVIAGASLKYWNGGNATPRST